MRSVHGGVSMEPRQIGGLPDTTIRSGSCGRTEVPSESLATGGVAVAAEQDVVTFGAVTVYVDRSAVGPLDIEEYHVANDGAVAVRHRQGWLSYRPLGGVRGQHFSGQAL